MIAAKLKVLPSDWRYMSLVCSPVWVVLFLAVVYWYSRLLPFSQQEMKRLHGPVWWTQNVASVCEILVVQQRYHPPLSLDCLQELHAPF